MPDSGLGAGRHLKIGSSRFPLGAHSVEKEVGTRTVSVPWNGVLGRKKFWHRLIGASGQSLQKRKHMRHVQMNKGIFWWSSQERHPQIQIASAKAQKRSQARTAPLETGSVLVKHNLLRTMWGQVGLGKVDRGQGVKSLNINLLQRSVRKIWLPRENNASASKDEAFGICKEGSFLILGAAFHSQNTKLLGFFNCHKANHFTLTRTNWPMGLVHQDCHNPHLWVFCRIIL